MDFAARQRLFEAKAHVRVEKTPEQIKADNALLADCIRVEGLLKQRRGSVANCDSKQPSKPDVVEIPEPVEKPRFADALHAGDNTETNEIIETNEITETNPVITKQEPETTDNPLCGDEFVKIETE